MRTIDQLDIFTDENAKRFIKSPNGTVDFR